MWPRSTLVPRRTSLFERQAGAGAGDRPQSTVSGVSLCRAREAQGGLQDGELPDRTSPSDLHAETTDDDGAEKGYLESSLG